VRDAACERAVSVAIEALNRDPLQRRPTVRRIPLLAGPDSGRHDTVRLDQFSLDDLHDGIRLRLSCQTDEERIQRSGGDVAGALAVLPG
jgi:hypothetical protein